jgi:hypothetical protein
MRMRLVGAALLAVAGLTVTVSPAEAAVAPTSSAPPAPGTFSVAPALTADGQARPYFQLSAAAGRSVLDVVAFGNTGQQTEVLRVGVTDGVTATNSGSAFGPLTSNCAGIACWVTGLPGTVTLAPHTQEEIEFEVKVPDGTRPAQYLAGITATPASVAVPAPVKNSGHGATQVTIVPRVVIGVAVTVGDLASLRTRTAVTGVTSGWVDGMVRLTVHVRNTGQRFAKGSGNLVCGTGSVEHTFGLSMDTVLPGQGAGLPVNGTGLGQGSWRCTAQVKDSGGGTDTWAGAVTVASTRPAATKRVGRDDYVAPDSPGIPVWAVVLMVLGGLILVSIWAVFLHRERDKRLHAG